MTGRVLSINRTVSDYVAKTRHLSVEDRGAYQEILDQIVLLGQDFDPPSLPDDDEVIANLLGWPVPKWLKTRARLIEGSLAVLIAAGGRISQTRIVEEIEAARGRMKGGSKGGKKSAEKRRVLRERMLKAGLGKVEGGLKEASKAASSQPPSKQENDAQNEQAFLNQSRVTSHEKTLSESSTSSDDVDEREAALTAIRAITPNLIIDNSSLDKWLEIDPDLWHLVAVLYDKSEAVSKAKWAAYLTSAIRDHVSDQIEDPRGYVMARLASLSRQQEVAQ